MASSSLFDRDGGRQPLDRLDVGLLDLVKELAGRAVYVHPRQECWARFERSQRKRAPLNWSVEDLCGLLGEQCQAHMAMSRRHGWVDDKGGVCEGNRVTSRLVEWWTWGGALGCGWVNEYSELANSEMGSTAVDPESQEPIYIGRGLRA